MILKYLFPFERFVIRSPLSGEDAVVVLQKHVGPRKLWPSTNDGNDFQGVVEGEGFRITRVIRYRNSFLPVVVGRLERAPGGCVMHIHMRMHFAVMAFSAVWVSFLVPVLIGFVVRSERGFDVDTLMPFGMLAFFLALTNGGFWFEANKQKKMLQDIFHQAAP